MFRFRRNLRHWCRGMSEDELAELDMCVSIRRDMSSDQREQAGSPEVADSSLAASLAWSWAVMWQDKPGLLIAGVASLLFYGAYQILSIGRHLLS